MTIRTLSISPFLLAALVGAAGCSSPAEEGAKGTKWVGHTYVAEPVSYIYQPDQFDSNMAEYVPNFLFKVNSASGDKIKMTMGTADSKYNQDECTPTAEVEATVSSYPNMEMKPIDFPMYLTNKGAKVTVKTTVKGLSFADIFPDGDTVSETGTFTATLDGREIYPLVTLLGDNLNPDKFCAGLNNTLKIPCEPCPDDEVYCVILKAKEFGAEEKGSVTKRSDRDSSCPEPTN